jgi:hypothetical protein
LDSTSTDAKGVEKGCTASVTAKPLTASRSSSSSGGFRAGCSWSGFAGGAWVWMYAFVMMSIGVVMFPNFYPWT